MSREGPKGGMGLILILKAVCALNVGRCDLRRLLLTTARRNLRREETLPPMIKRGNDFFFGL